MNYSDFSPFKLLNGSLSFVQFVIVSIEFLIIRSTLEY